MAVAAVVASKGGSSDEIEHMIGRRVEKMTPVFIIGFILCWAATAGGVYRCNCLPMGISVTKWTLCSISIDSH